MFGYVRPPQDLPEEEQKRFGRVYCGLCHTLGERYGTAARFILNYDFTFWRSFSLKGRRALSIMAAAPPIPSTDETGWRAQRRWP